MAKHNPKLNALHGLEARLKRQRKSAAPRALALFGYGWSALRAGLAHHDLHPANLVRLIHLRRCGAVLGVIVVVLGLGLAAMWWRLASGPISLDMATPWITAAIEENFGNHHRVDVGGTVIERDENGRTALRLRDVVVHNAEGAVVATAPRAEVGFSLLNWLGGNRRAQSLRLVGAEISLQIDNNGDIAVLSGGGSVLGSSPVVAAKPVVSLSLPRAGATAAPPKPAEALRTFLSWIEQLEALGLDGYDLNEIGLKNGTVVVNDQRNGRRTVFEQISLSLTRPRAGEVVLTAQSDHSARPWTLSAALKPIGNGRRNISVDAQKIPVGDLLLGFRLGNGQVEADLPVSARVQADISQDGVPELVNATLTFGAGQFGDVLDDPRAHLWIDRADVTIDWDSTRRTLLMPFQIVSGTNRITLIARAEAPTDGSAAWPVMISGGSVLLAPAGKYDDAPLLINRIQCSGRFDPVRKRFDIEHGDLGSKDLGIAFSSSVDFSGSEPKIAVGLASGNAPVAVLKQLWPANIVWPVRAWVLDHLIAGTVDRIEIAQNLPLSYLRPGGPPVPDEGLSIDIVTSGTAVQPVDSLPAIREASVVTRVRGHTATMWIDRASMELASGRKLSISNGVVEIPNTQIPNPPARARAKVDGPVPAVVEFLQLERLRDFSAVPLDPATSRGNVTAQVAFELPLNPDLPRGSVNYTVQADLSNFGVDRYGSLQRIEAQALKVVANTQGYQLKGDIKVAGTPASVELKKARDSTDSEVKFQAVFDDAARGRLGLDVLSGVTGPVPVKLSGRLASTPDQDTRLAIDADLTQAKIDNLLPSWIKPAGRAARATLTYVSKQNATRFEDIVVDGGGASIKGTVEIDGNGDIQSVNLPVFALSDGDKTNLKAERTPDGLLKVVMRGDIFDGRNFVKTSMSAPARDPQTRGPIADLDLDLKLGAVVGFNGEALRALDLKVTRKDGQIRNFSLGGKLGVDTPLTGELRGKAGQRQALYFETNDAGALFRFTDTYPRMIGGQMWVAMDPPTMDQAPQDGLLNIRDFVIRGEAALNNVVSGAPGGAPNGVEFSRLRVEFNRSPGKLTVRDGVVRGPLVGATIDGQIDYSASDVRLRGTFVPLYGLNNAFGQIPIVGLFLGGPNEGLLGITYEVVGPPGRSVLRVNPMSMVTPGLLRKFFEFPNPSAERFPDVSR